MPDREVAARPRVAPKKGRGVAAVLFKGSIAAVGLPRAIASAGVAAEVGLREEGDHGVVVDDAGKPQFEGFGFQVRWRNQTCWQQRTE